MASVRVVVGDFVAKRPGMRAIQNTPAGGCSPRPVVTGAIRVGPTPEHLTVHLRASVGATFLKEFVKPERSPSGELRTANAVRNRLFLNLLGDLWGRCC